MFDSRRIGCADTRHTALGFEISINFRRDLIYIGIVGGILGLAFASAVRLTLVFLGDATVDIPLVLLVLLFVVWFGVVMLLTYNFVLMVAGRQVILISSQTIRIEQKPWSIRPAVEYPLAAARKFRVEAEVYRLSRSGGALPEYRMRSLGEDDAPEPAAAKMKFEANGETVEFGSELNENEASAVLRYLLQCGVIRQEQLASEGTLKW